MIKKICVIVSAFVLILCICTLFFTNKNINKTNIHIQNGTSIMREVMSNGSNNKVQNSMRLPFIIDEIMTGNNYTFNTYIFSGTIVDIKNYEVEWIDEKDESWGPFNRNIIYIKLDKEYHGHIQKTDNIIKVLTTEDIASNNRSDLSLNIGEKYYFMNCWLLDNKYFDYISKENIISFENDISLKQADAIIGGVWNSIFPIVEKKVAVYNEYFSDNDIVMNNNLKTYSEFNMFIQNENYFIDNYIIIYVDYFENILKNLIKSYYN